MPDPSFAPASGSFSAGAPIKMPSFSHCVLTNSNWRFGIGADEDEDDAAVRAVVLQDAFGEHRAVARAEPEHAVQADVDAHLVIERVPGVRTPGMRAGRAFESAQIIAVAEAVVAAWVRAETGIVVLGAERERRAALPAADHLRAEQRLVLAARRFGAEVLPVGGDPGVKFPENQVGAVAARGPRGSASAPRFRSRRGSRG